MDEKSRRERWALEAVGAFELRWHVHLDQQRRERMRALQVGERQVEVTVAPDQPHTFMVSWVDILGSPLASSDSSVYPPRSGQVRAMFDQACDRLEQDY